MASGLIITFFVLLGLLMIVGLIFLIIRLSKKIKTDVAPNSNLIISLDTALTKGHSIGVRMNPDEDAMCNKSNTSELVKMRPLDVPYDKDGKPVESQPIKFAMRRNLMLRCPMGSLSHYRTVEILFPSSSAQIDSSLLATRFGKLLSAMTEKVNDNDSLLDNIRKSNIKRKIDSDMMQESSDKVIEFQRGALREMFEQKTRENKGGM